jgi:hypothetical protein
MIKLCRCKPPVPFLAGNLAPPVRFSESRLTGAPSAEDGEDSSASGLLILYLEETELTESEGLTVWSAMEVGAVLAVGVEAPVESMLLL